MPDVVRRGPGALVASFGAGSWAAGWALHWAELQVLGLACLALTAIALLVRWLPAPAHFALTARPLRTTVGGSIDVHLVVAPRLPVLAPEIHLPVGDDVRRMRLPVLLPGREHHEQVRLPATHRGVHDVGPVRLVRTDPLRLWPRLLECAAPIEVFVRPRVVELESIAPGVVNDLEGVPSDQISVSDLAFHALREYVPGDDLRHVHWRASARADHLLVRQYQETRRSSAVVFVDTRAASYAEADDFELAVSAAASVIRRALADDFEVALAWDEEVVAAERAHPDPLLDATCRLQISDHDPTAISRNTARVASLQSGASVVVVLSGAQRPAEELSLAVSAFGRDAERIVVRAGAASASTMAESHGLRVLTVSQLEHLPTLLLRGR